MTCGCLRQRVGCVSRFFQALFISSIPVAVCGSPTFATTYNVGPGQTYANIGAVPWESLDAGDVVQIHWRSTPYVEKWLIGGQGTVANPIIVRGIAGPAGQLPVIDGQNATTRLQLDYWSENRSVIKVGGSNIPDDVLPTHIIIENLDIRGARPPNTFTNESGTMETYSTNAAAIHIERGQYITVRNCILRDSGNGLFVSSSDDEAARDILIEGNYIHSNGNSGSIFHHNTYTAAIGITYQYNRFGPLLSGAGGNNLKDRSAGLVVRYNWIEGGNRQLDLVDGEDSSLIRNHPDYDETHVYGNILIEQAAAGNKQIIHYGGDSGTTANYRHGTMYFYHNTMVSLRTDSTTLMRLSTPQEHCDARNNILHVITGGNGLAMLDSDGVLDLSHNWTKPGWVGSFGTLNGDINDDGTGLTSSSPGFADFAGQDYRLASNSICLDEAAALHPNVLPDHTVSNQYMKHQDSKPRSIAGAAADLGAFEFNSLFDYDGDDDIGLADHAAFVECMAGPGSTPNPTPPPDVPTCLQTFDTNTDADVDAADFVEMQLMFTGDL